MLLAGSARRAVSVLGMTQPSNRWRRRSALQQAWELLRHVELAVNALERLEASIFAMKSDDRERIAIASPAVFGFVTLPGVVAIIGAQPRSHVRTISGTYDQVGEHIPRRSIIMSRSGRRAGHARMPEGLARRDTLDICGWHIRLNVALHGPRAGPEQPGEVRLHGAVTKAQPVLTTLSSAARSHCA